MAGASRSLRSARPPCRRRRATRPWCSTRRTRRVRHGRRAGALGRRGPRACRGDSSGYAPRSGHCEDGPSSGALDDGAAWNPPSSRRATATTSPGVRRPRPLALRPEWPHARRGGSTTHDHCAARDHPGERLRDRVGSSTVSACTASPVERARRATSIVSAAACSTGPTGSVRRTKAWWRSRAPTRLRSSRRSRRERPTWLRSIRTSTTRRSSGDRVARGPCYIPPSTTSSRSVPSFGETFAARPGSSTGASERRSRNGSSRSRPVRARPRPRRRTPTGDPAAARAEVGIGDEPPPVPRARRRWQGRGSRRMRHAVQATASGRFQPRVRGPGGGRAAAPPRHRDRGPSRRGRQWGLLRAAHALVSPSAYESFSIVLVEAWSVETPALVNRRSEVTNEQRWRPGAVCRSTGIRVEVALDRLGESLATRDSDGRPDAHMSRRIRWPDIVDRYAADPERIAPHAGT